jgi:ADP-heptose:LPS heptosyltransferase
VGELVPGVHRIAVLRANGLGDFIVAVPALQALRTAYPDARITLIGRPWHAALLAGRPGPWDEVVVAPPYPVMTAPPHVPVDSAEAAAFFTWARGQRFDLAVQLHGGGGQSNPFVASLGARLAVGARDTGAPALDRWLRYTLYQHEVLRWLEVVGLVGAHAGSFQPALTVTAADRSAAAPHLRPVPAGRPLVVIHPGASDPRRRWPPERFGAVAGELAGRGVQVVLVGDGEDVALCARVLAGAGPAAAGHLVDLSGQLSLPALVGVLARASLMVANDSGPRHLAEAVGTPTVGIYWVGNAITAAPLTRGRHRVAISFRATCPTCGDDQSGGRCSHDDPWVDDVGVGEVLTWADELLRCSGPAGSPADGDGGGRTDRVG